jgi:oligopeptide transport system permease protein
MPAEGRSPWALAMRRFLKNRRAVVSSGLLLLIGAATLAVPWLSPHPYDEPNWEYVQQRPNASYWFGTDALGRDMLVRSFVGGQISFAVGLLGTFVAVLIGVAYGATSGYLHGKVDLAMMRVVDILYGLPYMLIVIIVMTMFPLVFLVIGGFSWLTMARIVRGQVLSLREREFVEAARALGATAPAIIWRHMIPNLLGPVVVYTTLTVPAVMLSEAFLSFLGLGISEPMTSWGVLISEGANAIAEVGVYWWLIVFPGALFTATLYCLNSVGDGIRDAFDVQQR